MWTYHTPKFNSDTINPSMLKYSPWAGHRNFAYDYVANTKPRTVVELGTHYGSSFFAFLQAVEDGTSPDTLVYGIDAWGYVDGNEWTKVEYETDIYEIFLKTLEAYTCTAHPIRMTFDEAAQEFDSIDLLHIDGTHTYEAVKHDYETWESKINADGVILFHDISETSYLHDDASPKFWKELKARHPYTLEFDHCYGLGIFCKGPNAYDKLKRVDFSYYQRINNMLDVQNRDDLRKNYFRLKDNDTYIAFLKEQIEIKEQEKEKYRATIAGKDSYIEELRKSLRNNCRQEGQQNYANNTEEAQNARTVSNRTGLLYRILRQAMPRQHS